MLLEDPSGAGRGLVASRSGERHAWPDGRDADSFLDAWSAQLAQRQGPSPAPACVVYAAYEAGGMTERLPEPVASPPVATFWCLYPDWSVCIEPGAAYLAANDPAMLDELEAMLHRQAAHATGGNEREGGERTEAEWVATPGSDYMAAVRRVKDYIAAGDIFQANIARFWEAPFPEQRLSHLYARLRQVNPAPFSGWMRVEGEDGVMHILSASPERLFRISPQGWVETRPIAGTRRRGVRDDEAMRRDLLLSEKERAEHIMLVDLERNDLGRVCRPGTVEVNERMVVERYATVQHIVSNVRGRLRPECDVVDVFRAMFPGGTITGCPKVRCMEIIHELESRPRGPYTGGMGYVAWDGTADMNILIRSFWHVGGRLHWAAGAGIVADSDPERELMETEHKAAGLLRAL